MVVLSKLINGKMYDGKIHGQSYTQFTFASSIDTHNHRAVNHSEFLLTRKFSLLLISIRLFKKSGGDSVAKNHNNN